MQTSSFKLRPQSLGLLFESRSNCCPMLPGTRSLPYDILVLIVSWAPRTTWTTLCLVCRDFYHLAASRLYGIADFDSELGKTPQTYRFLNVISSSLHLGFFVSELSIGNVPDTALPIFVPALRKMPNLRHFYCKQLGKVWLYDPSVFNVIAALPALRSFKAIWSRKYDLNDLLDRLPPLKSITVDADRQEMGALERLLIRSRDTLQSFAPRAWDLDSFLQARGRGIVWSHMTELRVDKLRSTLPLEAFSNLEALHVVHSLMSVPAHILGHPTILPRLRQLRIAASARPEAVDRALRRLLPHLDVHIHFFADINPTSLLDWMAAFSWQHLLSLQFTSDRHMATEYVLEILPALLDGCTQLVFFAMSAGDWPAEAGPETNALLRMLDTLNGMPGSVMLPNLRYLTLLSVNWDPDATEWQVADAMEAIEGKVDPIFQRALGLRILQYQLGETQTCWGRDSMSHGSSSGAKHTLEQDDMLPIGLPDVVEYLEGQF